MKLDLPSAVSLQKEEKGMTISVTKERIIMINKQEVELNKLQAFIKQNLNEKNKTKIILNADRNIAYYFIVEVLDQIRLGGGLNITLQAKKKSSENG